MLFYLLFLVNIFRPWKRVNEGRRVSMGNDWTSCMMRTLDTKRKMRIIAKHVTIRLSFTITTTKFWRPDMNDCGLDMRTPPISPLFILNFTLCRFLIASLRFLASFSCKPGKLSWKFSQYSHGIFRFSLSRAAPHLSAVRHTRSLSVRLSSAQHKFPRRVIFTIFSSLG